MAWSQPSHTWFQSLATVTKVDATLSKIYQDFIENAGKSGEYVVQQDVITWKGRIMLPRDEKLLQNLDKISYFKSGRPCWNYNNLQENKCSVLLTQNERGY